MPSLSIAAFAPSLHEHTPTLAVIDPQGQLTRVVRYCRSTVGAVAEARVERFAFDSAQRNTAQWDARLWAKAQAGENVAANLRFIHDLSGRVLASETVDAGWTVELFGDAAETRHLWDSRESQHTTAYDEWLRPAAMFEQAKGQEPHCVERMTYASAADTDGNRCGQVIRHDDPAGTLTFPAFGLTGQPLSQKRRFLKTLDGVNWPDSETARDALLETDAAYTTAWTYDATDTQLSQTDARGHTQRQAMTVDGQLKRVWLQVSGNDEQVLVSQIDYDASANPVREVYGNHVTQSIEYGTHTLRPRRLKTQRVDGPLLQDSLYAHDPAGNVVRFEDTLEAVKHFANRRTDGVSTYGYDTLDQLIIATGRKSAGPDTGPQLPTLLPLPAVGDASVLLPYTHTYRYDAGGNLLEQRQTGSDPYTRTMAVAPNSNRSLVHAEGQPEPDFDTGFDANGNQQFLAPGQPMEWDVRNQLKRVVQVRRADGIDDDERYSYDANNSRVRKVATSQSKNTLHTAQAHYLPGIEIRNNTATGEALEVITVSAGHANVRVLHWTENKPDDIPNNQVRYQVGDLLDSVTLELDNTGQVISREGYYPFGGTAWQAARSEIEASYKVVRYSGQERDATGLVYYGLRYYAPWLNRWINPDPAGNIDGLNVYRMVRNNPITLKDIDGLGPLEDEKYVTYLKSLIAKKPDTAPDKLIKKLKEKYPKAAPTKTIEKQLVAAASMAGTKSGSALSAVRGATEQKVQAEKERETKVKKERADDDSRFAIDVIWNTNIGFQYLKGRLPGTDKNIGSMAISELEKRDANTFHGQSGLRSAVKNLNDASATALGYLFEKRIQSDLTKIRSVFRGMDGAKTFYQMAVHGVDYIPDNFVAASSSEEIAKGFSKGNVMTKDGIKASNNDPAILELSGKAASIVNIFTNQNEQEYVFSRGSKFQVSHVQGNRFKLTQRS